MRWRLEAEQALIFDDRGPHRLRSIAVDVSEPRPVLDDRGRRGRPVPGDEERRDPRNVVLTSSDGLRLETSVLRWHGRGAAAVDGRAGDDSRASGVGRRGHGLESRVSEEATTVTGRVRAVFTGAVAEPVDARSAP